MRGVLAFAEAARHTSDDVATPDGRDGPLAPHEPAAMRSTSIRLARTRTIGAVVLLALTGAACGSIVENDRAAESRLSGSETMRLQLSRTSATEGEPLPLTVTLTNTTSANISFEGNTCPHNVYEVEDADGTRIDPRIELILCAAVTIPTTLTPGQSKSWSLEWNAARYAPSKVHRPAGAQQVRIRARYWVNRAEVSSPWQTVTVQPAR
jgi:hypothetical protein